MWGKGLRSHTSPFGPYNVGDSSTVLVDESASVDVAAAVRRPRAAPPGAVEAAAAARWGQL